MTVIYANEIIEVHDDGKIVFLQDFDAGLTYTEVARVNLNGNGFIDPSDGDFVLKVCGHHKAGESIYPHHRGSITQHELFDRLAKVTGSK